MSEKHSLKYLPLIILTGMVASAGIGFGVGAITTNKSWKHSYRKISSIKQVQQGYISPNKLKIQCKDLDYFSLCFLM